MQVQLEVLAEGVTNAEGPVVLPDGRVVYTDTYRGQLNVWSESDGERIFAKVGGYPNGATLGEDGYVYIANNGGLLGGLRSFDTRRGYIQRVREGERPELVAESVAGHELNRPNDLAFGPDGRLYFTDPGTWKPEDPDPGFIFALEPDGSGEVVLELSGYPNGIALEDDGALLWVESFTGRLMRRKPGGEHEQLHVFEQGHMPDGFARAATGDIYVATLLSGGLHVVHPGGGADFIDLGGTTLTNCAFRGDAIILTDAGDGATNPELGPYWGDGRLVRMELGTSGVELATGSIVQIGGAR
jgi:gluconolactonase